MKTKIIAIIIVILTIVFQMLSLAIPQSRFEALLVYNSPGDYGMGNNTIRGISRALTISGARVSLKGINEYTKGITANFDCVVIFCPLDDQVKQELLDDLAIYSGKIIWIGKNSQQILNAKAISSISIQGVVPNVDSVSIDLGAGQKKFILNKAQNAPKIVTTNPQNIIGYINNSVSLSPFAVKDGNITVISISSDNEILYYALTKIVNTYYQPEIKHKSCIYIKLGYIYPISDFELIEKQAKYLKDNQLPFTFVVMPIYENTDLPEMDEYIKLLTFIRDCGGTPIIHCPVINQIEPNPNDMNLKLTRALEIYTQRGIYPIGIEAPEMLLYKAGFETFFNNFTTYFYEKGIGKDTWKLSSPSSLPTFEGKDLTIPSFKIAFGETNPIDGKTPANSIGQNIVANVLDDAFNEAVLNGQPYTVSIPSWIKFETFKQTIDFVINSGIKVSNVKDFNHAMDFATHRLEYTDNWIILDGKQMENLQFKAQAMPKPTEAPKPDSNVSRINAFITAIAGMAIIFFIVALVWARKINIGKFFRK